MSQVGVGPRGSRRISSPDGREFDNERPTDEASTGDGLVLTSSTVAASSGAVWEVNEGRRRLVIMSRDTQEMERKHMRTIPENDDDQDSESDTIVGGVSEAGEDALEEPTAPESPIRLRPRGRQEAFASLDVVELKSVFSRRAHFLRTIPFILKGAFRSALRTTLDKVIAGHNQGNESRMTRGWKLFMFLPRLLLHCPASGGMVPRKKLEERVFCFQEGVVSPCFSPCFPLFFFSTVVVLCFSFFFFLFFFPPFCFPFFFFFSTLFFSFFFFPFFSPPFLLSFIFFFFAIFLIFLLFFIFSFCFMFFFSFFFLFSLSF